MTDPLQPPPPPYEPPPPGPPVGDSPLGNPWDRRDELGFGNALIETIKLFVVNPTEGFAQTRRQGDFASPLLFAVIIGWVCAVIGQIWSLMFQSTWMSFMPPEFQQQMGAAAVGAGAQFLISVILAPIFIAIAAFIWSGILHVFLMILGAASEAGFEGTFRAYSYSAVASLAQVIPIIGGLIALFWLIVLQVIGISTLHRTSTGKAAAAVLLPIALCCLCGILVAVMLGASIAGALSSAQ
jgi:hypothetical protein